MRFLTAALFTTILSAPAFAADLGMYRPGTPYSSSVAAGADVCDNQCAGDAQCRGWNYVKPNPRAAGVCEFLSSVSSPISSQISISGESQSATPFSTRVTQGATNTVRVGTTVTPRTNSVKVGQTPSGRRIVRQAPSQQIAPQTASTRPIQDMSLTAQQNRYRQGQAPVKQPMTTRGQPVPPQPTRQMFRPILDAPAPQQAPISQQTPRPQQAYAPQRPVAAQPQPQYDPRHAATQRRATGPRNIAPRSNPRGIQHPLSSMGQPAAPHPQSSRPPIGQPIPAPHAMQSQATPPRVMQSRATTPSQRVAQLTAQSREQAQLPSVGQPIPPQGPIALSPEQARRSLFGRLNDDVKAPENTPQDMPIVTAVPSKPVTQEALSSPYGDLLAGGR